MYKYTCLNPIADVGLKVFSKEYEKVEQLEDAQAVLVRSAAMHDLELPEGILAIARAGAGVNNIPLEECAKKGVVVFNTPGANANGVKELVLAGMLYASRDIVGGMEWLLDNQDDEGIAKKAEKKKKNFAGHEILGKKLGVIGLGAIGVLVANAAAHLGMEVYGYDPYISVNAAWNLDHTVKHIGNVEDIYKTCDFITIHVPLLDSTKGMISKEAISMMKENAVVLNFARDLLVDEKAIVEALEEEKIGCYVSDFPNPITVGAKGCIVTPHLGASTAESEDNCAVMAAKELRDYIENGNIVHSVNYPDCSMGLCETVGRISIMHKNNKGMIAKYTTILGDADVNVSDLTNKGKGEYAYSLIDVDSKVSDDVLEKLSEIDGVFRVRRVK
ncbi:D-3-phosphoglycerate dehydrogenase [Lachnospiraceae bacterium C7]|nr:D-3-phosphoglycerate dehydrogenase [Lachnospiraceae bacterium C7]